MLLKKGAKTLQSINQSIIKAFCRAGVYTQDAHSGKKTRDSPQKKLSFLISRVLQP